MTSLSMLTSGSLSADMNLTGTSGNFWVTRNVFSFPLNHAFKLREFTVYVSFCNDVFLKKREQVNYLNQVLAI